MALAHTGRAVQNKTARSSDGGPDIGALPDGQFQDLLIKHAHQPSRDPAIWAQFTSAQFIAQTRSVLAMLYTRNQCTMERRAAEISATQAECIKLGHRGRQKYIEANAKYKRWRVGAANFGRTISGALEEVNEIYDRHVDRSGAGQQALRSQLAAALEAIKDHQKQSDAGDYEPASHDLQLWKVLEDYGEGIAPTTQPNIGDDADG